MLDEISLESLRASLLALTPAQQLAVESIASGSTHQVAAEHAGVTRETVTRWPGHLPAFQAVGRYRAALLDDRLATARRIRGKALGSIEEALDAGEIDPIVVLKAVGAPSQLSQRTLGPCSTLRSAKLDELFLQCPCRPVMMLFWST